MTTPRQPGSPGAQQGLLPWGVARIRGASMQPTLRHGDRVLVRYLRSSTSVRAGAVVIARWVDGTVVCKRAEPRSLADGRHGWWLTSDNPEQGVDSRHGGPVSEEALLGVAVARIWPRPRRLPDLPPPT